MKKYLNCLMIHVDKEMERTIFTELKNLQKIHPFTVFYTSHNRHNQKYSDYIYEIYSVTRSINKKVTTENECE